jgi:hypothetical protein
LQYSYLSRYLNTIRSPLDLWGVYNQWIVPIEPMRTSGERLTTASRPFCVSVGLEFEACNFEKCSGMLDRCKKQMEQMLKHKIIDAKIGMD